MYSMGDVASLLREAVRRRMKNNGFIEAVQPRGGSDLNLDWENDS